MEQQSFWKYLRSADAIFIHLLCGGMIVLFSILLWNGTEEKDLDIALIFMIGAYPILLWLQWSLQNDLIKQAVSDKINAEIAPEKYRAGKKLERKFVLSLTTIGAMVLIYQGKGGLLLNGISAVYWGYALLGMVVLGLAGVNIWRGGPLDLRNDPPPTTNDEE